MAVVNEDKEYLGGSSALETNISLFGCIVLVSYDKILFYIIVVTVYCLYSDCHVAPQTSSRRVYEDMKRGQLAVHKTPDRPSPISGFRKPRASLLSVCYM